MSRLVFELDQMKQEKPVKPIALSVHCISPTVKLVSTIHPISDDDYLCLAIRQAESLSKRENAIQRKESHEIKNRNYQAWTDSFNAEID